MTAYYNENDPYAAQWLRNLIEAGEIAPGYVDDRSIVDVRPDELDGYTQCHFFAGIGVWSYALRRAGWSDDRPVWTGSCPCQPFSAAGKGAGFDDERHLWPHFHWLISQCAPPVVLGEQVASKDGLAWLDLVQADLEGTGYASGAVDLCAAGVGAPHIRQRLWWVAERGVGLADNSGYGRVEGRSHGRRCAERTGSEGEFGRVAECCAHGRLDHHHHHHHQGLERQRSGHQAEGGRVGEVRPVAETGELGGLGHPGGAASERNSGTLSGAEAREYGERFGFYGGELVGPEHAGAGVGCRQPGPTNGFWRDPDWLFCRDGKWRPVEPGTFPLAHGLARGMGTLQPELCRLAEVAGLDGKSLARAKAHRIGSLKGYGNAIVAEAAAEVIAAFMDVYGVPSLERRVAA